MKITPEEEKIQTILRSDKIVCGGFLGQDTRKYFEIIEDDAIELGRLGVTKEWIGERMEKLTELATGGLGSWVKLGNDYEGRIDEVKGLITCPWSHPDGLFRKRVTMIRRLKDGVSLMWSDLSMHLIKAHGFFQGKGSAFRIEPEILVTFLKDIEL